MKASDIAEFVTYVVGAAVGLILGAQAAQAALAVLL